MSTVVFNSSAFLTSYPEFTATLAATPTAGQACFNNACLYLDNTDTSRVPDPPRTDLLYMLTAHILVLRFGVNGQPASGLVGRISSAGQGSINVSTDMGPGDKQSAWYEQTQYGASYYRATMGYRSALYVPPACQPKIYRSYGG